MDHREFIRVVKKSDTAVLMIHGIAGSPRHFGFLIPAIPENCSIFNILLDGHNAGVEDFSRTSMKKWKAQVKDILRDILHTHAHIVIVAHSMGALFAIQAAIDHPDRINGLFLLSVPTRPRMKISTMCTAIKVALGAFGTEDERANAMFNDTGIHLEKQLWKYIGWIPRSLELLSECRRVRRIIPKLNVQTQSYHCQRDELVSKRAFKDMEGHHFIDNRMLCNSGHFSYGKDDAQFLASRLRTLLCGISTK